MNKKAIGIILSVVISIFIWNFQFPGDLPPAGQKALTVTIFTVIWWIFGITHPAYTTLLMFVGYVLFGLATPAVVFKFMTLPLMWLIFGAFLIARAVTKSGLANRVAYFFMIRFARSYRSIVVLSYVLGFVLSFLIPHPFPRALLIMALVTQIIKKSGANAKDAATLGLGVFVSITPTSMILLTGDATLNIAAVAFSGTRIGWLEWIKYMAVPGIAASILMLGLHLLLFKQTGPISIDQSELIEEKRKLGKMSRDELITAIWLVLALVLWATDFLHGIDPSWVALIVTIGLSLPKIGGILEGEDINTGVSWPIVIFVIGALAIGTVGTVTGLSAWLAHVALPSSPPENVFLFALIIAISVIVIHMIMGSALACMSIVSPTVVQYASEAGWSPIFPALLIYTAVQIHYVLAYQHVTILLGKDDVGFYGNQETIKYGLPLTAVVIIVIVLIEVPWWKAVGLL